MGRFFICLNEGNVMFSLLMKEPKMYQRKWCAKNKHALVFYNLCYECKLQNYKGLNVLWDTDDKEDEENSILPLPFYIPIGED